MPSSNRNKTALQLKRLANFLKVLIQNKRGMLGIGILVFFTVVALGAPLLTPYNPISRTKNIAADLAYPSWFKYLPSYGKPSENLNPIKNPDFNTATSLQDWKFVANTTPSPTYSFNSDLGGPSTGPGCVAITFTRDTSQQAEAVKANLTEEFYYPYEGPPQRFMGEIYVKVDGVQDARPWGVEIKVFIQQAGGETRYLWSARQGGDYRSGAWITPSLVGEAGTYPPLIDSNMVDPQQAIFSKQTNYKYGVELTFSKDVNASNVYIDDFDLRLYGRNFGLLGTDNSGRDIFTQLLYGTRISLLVGLLASLISVSLGLIIGLVAAYMGRLVDEGLMRFTDMFLVLPELPLLLVIVAVMGASIWNIILIIGFLGWMGFARTVRSQALSLKERPFVEAAKALGSGRTHIITRHILPNVMNLVYVTLAITVPGAIMSEAYISFLGLYDPYIMTWGRMFHDASEVTGGYAKWWWTIPPGLCIAIISISFVLIGYALDEILNPKLRERR